MYEITLDDICSIAGNYVKRGNEYIFRCPVCAASGGDSSKDNLRFNYKKNVLYCFACGGHIEILKEINRRKYNEKLEKDSLRMKKWELNKEKYFEYQHLVNQDLLNMPDKLNYLEKERFINPETVLLCGIGYDYESKKWVFPIFNTLDDLLGFEYRAENFAAKNIWREKGTPNALAHIFGRTFGKDLFILEGFLDAYLFSQYQTKAGEKDFAVMSCGSGVSGLFNSFMEINFNKFKNIKLFLDNDEAGDKATEKILEKFPFVSDIRHKIKPYKDFTDWYRTKRG